MMPGVDGGPRPGARPIVGAGPERDRLLRALVWLYGSDRANNIIAGRDFATLLDLKLWRALGTSRTSRP